MKRLFIMVIISFTTLVVWAQGKYTMDYVVTLDTEHHFLNIELTMDWGNASPSEVMLKLPVWAPGYYQIMDYPKYVTDFAVKDLDGNDVTWTKVGKTGWQFSPSGKVKVSYRVYANMRSVADSMVGKDMAFIAPNGVFMYVDGDKEHQVTVTYVMPESWKNASTSLEAIVNEGKERKFLSPDFDTLYDSPVLLGNHMVKKTTHEGHEYEFAIVGYNGFEESGFEKDFLNMVSATSKLIGDVPYDKYCVIHLGPGGGGLEHLSSQACYTSGSYKFHSRNDYLRHLSFVSHEYFHLYNVKSIRPFELGPFDYDREVFTSLLWVSEGFTCYYENKNLISAGIVDVDFLLSDVSSGVRTIETAEGRKHMSLRQSSYDIWLNFMNRMECSDDLVISYYDKGPVFGLLFDIEIADATNGKACLDDLMRLLYNRYYKQKQRGFTEEEFWQAAAEVAGKPLAQLRHYVDTTDEIDYESILKLAGLEIDRTSWKITQTANPDSRQKKIFNSMFKQN